VPIASVWEKPFELLSSTPNPCAEILTHNYMAVEIRWENGTTKSWVAVPNGLTELEVQKLLFEKGLING
jgi:hypothetical protein